MIESKSWFEKEIGARITVQVLICDRCGEKYPVDGTLTEGAAVEAAVRDGWDTIDGDDLCPGCQVDRAIQKVHRP